MSEWLDLSREAERTAVFVVLAIALVLFIYGRWRYDLVAVFALLIIAVLEIVPAGQVFGGFGHPAVITVGAVLVISRGLINSGAVELLVSRLSILGDRPVAHLVGLTALVVILSGFINNIGALALLMPVAIKMSRDGGYSPSLLLMPLAFGSLLGGMMTMIGTPPNVVVATVSFENGRDGFGMFDFLPVGAGIALAGLAFIALGGWRLVPQRTSSDGAEGFFDTDGFVAELEVVDDSAAVGLPILRFEQSIDDDVLVAGLFRGDERVLVPSAFEVLRPGDVLLVEADSSALEELVKSLGVVLHGRGGEQAEQLTSNDIQLLEAVVLPRSILESKSATSINLRWRYGLNLLAVARRGARLRQRLGDMRLQAGDVLLLQGQRNSMHETLTMLGAAPIATREWNIEKRPRLILAVALFASGIALTALGVLPVQIALAAAAFFMIIAGIVNVRDAYESIDWPILVLLGAMIPVGGALETTGGAAIIADGLYEVGGGLPPAASIAALLIVTMFLSDLVNNAAAAVLMAPIALRLSTALDAAAEPFLMAVAVGASCAFLTPIGHQSNTLVMGPGGYKFSDYWRLGAPLQVVIIASGLPLILLVWPP